jgi:aminobenzoyl-glutamate transport protein
VSPLANWYFMAFSTPVITLLGWFVAERFTAPRFPDGLRVDGEDDSGFARDLTPAERRGLRYAGIASLSLTLLLLWSMLSPGSLPGAGFLRNPDNGDLLDSPLLSGVVAIIFLFGAVSGLAYGIGAGTIRSDEDVIKGMSTSMSTLGSYLVLVFFAAQFVAFFNWTQLGLIFAVNGAEGLKSLGLSAVPLFATFILLTASINLLMGSASAKWALMAPVFVPMFMLLGYSPELTQTAYRVGDSVTNIISPMMSYFALIIAFFQKYEPRTGLGTIVAVMLPYSATFLIGWSVVFGIWLALGLPIGPDSPLEYPASRTE